MKACLRTGEEEERLRRIIQDPCFVDEIGVMVDQCNHAGDRVINPFARRESLTRTPQGAGEEVPEEEVGKEEKIPKKMKKRMANNSPQIIRQAASAEPNPELIKMKKKIEELVKYGKANKNVHVEVKKTANELNLLINRTISSDRRRISETVNKQEEEQQEKSMNIKKTKKAGTQICEGEEGRKLETINEGTKEEEKGFQIFCDNKREKGMAREGV
ncbi:hypothetical protein FQA39_LY05234 [Lamprigera yunnana]|nr:hypothetical protein FQA39_LY05234 [Lamprigera yunnana]